MAGGTGNDVYYVNDPGDQVIEGAGQGTDTIRSTVDYVLAAGQEIENLRVFGTAGLALTGNGFGNRLSGGIGDDTLDGGAGSDWMRGAAGNDTYTVDNAGDSVIEINGGGADRVDSSVSFSLAGQYIERLTLTGSGNIDGTGNTLDNVLTGNAGDNILNGERGADVLAGGGGSDVFGFTTSLAAGNIDTITDFSVGVDSIRLSHAVFNTIVGTGTLTAAQFAANAGGTAQDADDRIIYETDTGKLFYDSNGSAAGGAVQFAKLSSGLVLTASDFSIG